MPSEYFDDSLTLSELHAIYKDLQQSIIDSNVSNSMDERKKEIMNLLHEFNYIKDAAQIVLGSLANLEGRSIKEMHLQYNLPLRE